MFFVPLFGSVGLGVPQRFIFNGVGQVLLLDEMPLEIMGIKIFLAIAQLFHQSRGGIAQVEGDR